MSSSSFNPRGNQNLEEKEELANYDTPVLAAAIAAETNHENKQLLDEIQQLFQQQNQLSKIKNKKLEYKLEKIQNDIYKKINLLVGPKFNPIKNLIAYLKRRIYGPIARRLDLELILLSIIEKRKLNTFFTNLKNEISADSTRKISAFEKIQFAAHLLIILLIDPAFANEVNKIKEKTNGLRADYAKARKKKIRDKKQAKADDDLEMSSQPQEMSMPGPLEIGFLPPLSQPESFAASSSDSYSLAFPSSAQESENEPLGLEENFDVSSLMDASFSSPDAGLQVSSISSDSHRVQDSSVLAAAISSESDVENIRILEEIEQLFQKNNPSSLTKDVLRDLFDKVEELKGEKFEPVKKEELREYLEVFLFKPVHTRPHHDAIFNLLKEKNQDPQGIFGQLFSSSTLKSKCKIQFSIYLLITLLNDPSLVNDVLQKREDVLNIKRATYRNYLAVKKESKNKDCARSSDEKKHDTQSMSKPAQAVPASAEQDSSASRKRKRCDKDKKMDESAKKLKPTNLSTTASLLSRMNSPGNVAIMPVPPETPADAAMKLPLLEEFKLIPEPAALPLPDPFSLSVEHENELDTYLSLAASIPLR